MDGRVGHHDIQGESDAKRKGEGNPGDSLLERPCESPVAPPHARRLSPALKPELLPPAPLPSQQWPTANPQAPVRGIAKRNTVKNEPMRVKPTKALHCYRAQIV